MEPDCICDNCGQIISCDEYDMFGGVCEECNMERAIEEDDEEK
jgi:Zn finger protein HypA/HybF involved in hydrogenase expression